MIPDTPTADEWREMVDHQRAKSCGVYHQALLTLVGFVYLFGNSVVALVVRPTGEVISVLSAVRETAAGILEYVWR